MPETTSQDHQRFPARSVADPQEVLRFAIETARLLADDKCDDVLVLDVRDLSQVTDYIVLGSGTSERQMGSVLDHVQDLGSEMGFNPFATSGDKGTAWVLTDFIHVVVHLFEPNTRAHYDLEMLWGDAPRVDWSRERSPSKRG